MISVPGIGSGLDINSIVTSLVAAEGDAKTLLLANQRSDTQFEVSAFGALKSTLSSFATSLTFLKSADNFQENILTSSDTSVFTATSSSGAIASGIFDVEVRDFAEAHKLMTSGFTDQDTVVGTGTLTIFSGSSSFDVTIDNNNETLAGIRNAINNAEDNTGVSATIINVDDGVGGTEAKLILSSDDTGTDNAITITVADDDLNDTDASGLSAFYYDTSDGTTPERLTQINAAIDAEIYIDGQKVLSASNTVIDAIDGVTINIHKEDSGNIHGLTVANDTGTVKSNIQSFVSNYNTLVTFMNDVTEFDPATGEAAVLLGDATTRNISNQIRTRISDAVTGITGQFTTLVDVGITTNSDGTLKINSNTLDAAIDENIDDVSALFSSTNGVATKLDSIVNEYVKTDGLLDSKTNGLNSTIENINEDLEALELSLIAFEERLLAQFSAMDALVAQLNSTSSFLTQQFEAIKNINDRS
ncbi:MAG: flagellar hook-associated protein 2 [marine bacterium B5-7]|nr:MAG: flagellar hook-associated protein 2 [marine bacterium B5-7]